VAWSPKIGEPLPRGEDAYNVHEKLRDYALNLQQEDGRHKAVVFKAALGITAADVDYLANAVLAGISVTPIRAVRENLPWGYNCEVRVPIRGLHEQSERTVEVSTVWEVRHGGDPPRLVTAFVTG
jgi:hypothetical protein